MAPRIFGRRVLLHLDAVERGHGIDGHDRQQQRVFSGLADLHRMIVNLDDSVTQLLAAAVEHAAVEPGDRTKAGEKPVGGAGAADRFTAREGVDEIIGAENVACAAFDPLAQMHRPGMGGHVMIPTFDQPAFVLTEIEPTDAVLIWLVLHPVVEQRLHHVDVAELGCVYRHGWSVVVQPSGNVFRQIEDLGGLRHGRRYRNQAEHGGREQTLEPYHHRVLRLVRQNTGWCWGGRDGAYPFMLALSSVRLE